MSDRIRIAIPGKEQNTFNYIDALTRLGAEAVCITTPDIDPACYDGMLIPGGGDISPEFYGEKMNGSEDPEREFDLRQMAAFSGFLQAQKPILGICRGIQVLNVCLGGSLIQDLNSKERHSRMGGNDDRIHPCHAVRGSVMERLYGESFMTNSAHHQAVKVLGKGLKITLTSFDGTVEAVEHTELPILGVQWHPERMCFKLKRNDGSVDGKEILQAFLDLCARKSCR